MRTDEPSDRDVQSSRFGRKDTHAAAIPAPATSIGDLRLFALTFAGGFLFMTVYLA